MEYKNKIKKNKQKPAEHIKSENKKKHNPELTWPKHESEINTMRCVA